MARRNKSQINADRIIKKELLKLGSKIYDQSVKESRVALDTYYAGGGIRKAGGTLRDSQNFRVKPDTVLTVAQVYYGQFNYPAGVTSGEKNALLIAVKQHVPESTKIIVTEITDELLKNFK